jgi:hypothetical protein
MSLYLVEVRLDVSTPEKRTKAMERVEQVVKEGGTPTARLVAGPWASMENPTVLFVLENPDLNQSMPGVIELFNAGLIIDTRVRPIMAWEGVKAAAAKAGG